MTVPEEFYDFCLYLHQDSASVYGPDVQDWITGALGHMTHAQRRVLRGFLDDLVSSKYSDEQIARLYRSTNAEIAIENARLFFSAVRDTITRGEAVEGR